jgi:lipopolysaccharide/colanic/teichoic acid biosynthesis glycosyltransferase
MWKLRTMVVDADRVGGALTAGSDPRVTALGRLLRRFKLDELPQLVHVLTGRMSLIGPRPESPAYVELSDPRWRRILAVRPGVTDLASLAYRNEEALLAAVSDREGYYRARLLPAKLALSQQAIARRCWRFDLRLLLYTARYSLFPRRFSAAGVKRAFLEDARA